MSNFINNLRATIDSIEIYAPTGKYGKYELNRWDTAKEKLEKFLFAEPNSAEDINDYVLFAQSLNALSYKEVYKKIESLLEYSKFSPNDLRLARKIFRKAKMKKNLKLTLIILVWVICISLAVAWYVFYVQNWAGFWRVLWCFYGPFLLLFLSGCISAGIDIFKDKNPFLR